MREHDDEGWREADTYRSSVLERKRRMSSTAHVSRVALARHMDGSSVVTKGKRERWNRGRWVNRVRNEKMRCT